MVLAMGPLHDTEIMQHIKDTTEAVLRPRDEVASDDLDFVFPILGHPTMRPDVGFVEFISLF
jgi:hypothetical protein